MMASDATCRFCGSKGREDEGDPAPGVCPECLDGRIAFAMPAVSSIAAATRLQVKTRMRRATSILVEVGLTRQLASDYAAMLVAAAENDDGE